MFVSKKAYDSEREARLRAESLNDSLLRLLESERAAHRQEVADLLVRSLPKPREPVPGFGLPAALPVSAAELSRMPAVGKRGVRERNAAVRDAELREEQRESQKQLTERRSALSPEEARRLDEQIPAPVPQ